MAFNTYIDRRSSHVTIHQQPNDAADAARLYGELEDKAAKSIKDAVFTRVEPIGVELVAYARDLNPASLGETYHVAFMVNDAKYEVRVDVSEYVKIRDGNYFDFVEKHVIPAISRELIFQIARKDQRWLKG